MNKYIESEANQHVMKLRQMGAEVTIVSGQMVYVSFDINDDIKVSYVYNINKKNRYFLERIKPYPIAVREFESADDICNIIKIDIEQFKIAIQSHNIKEFIQINYDFHKTILMFEDLFLYYNIKHDTISTIEEAIDKIHKAIIDAKETSSRVFFEKDPDNLNE
jgi:hypothetical protein